MGDYPPRLAGVTHARYLLFGANTPWNRVRLTLLGEKMIAFRAAYTAEAIRSKLATAQAQ